jgi:hypothetical protein
MDLVNTGLTILQRDPPGAGRLQAAVSRLLRRDPHEPGTPHEPPHTPTRSDHPDFSNPDIDPKNVTDYAMNPDHPVSGNKYRVINSKTGMDTQDASLIEQQIRDGVRSGTPILGKADQYGQRWAEDEPLTGPKGTTIVRTAWILDAGSTTPRMVTISFP